jgi:hypothetical protein
VGKLAAAETAELGNFAARRLLKPPRSSIQLQPSYKEALIAWALHVGSLTYAQYEKLILEEKDWWVKKSALRGLEERRLPPKGVGFPDPLSGTLKREIELSRLSRRLFGLSQAASAAGSSRPA